MESQAAVEALLKKAVDAGDRVARFDGRGLVDRLKLMAMLDIVERRTRQHGLILGRFGGKSYAFLVETNPSGGDEWALVGILERTPIPPPRSAWAPGPGPDVPSLVTLPLPASTPEDLPLRVLPDRVFGSARTEGFSASARFHPGQPPVLELRFSEKVAQLQRRVELHDVLAAWLPVLGIPADDIFVEACRYGIAPLIDARLERPLETRVAARALKAAADSGALELVKKLVAMGAPVRVDAKKDGVWPALTGALDVEIAGFLLDAGADVDAGGPNGVTPLMLAARYGNLPLMRLLLSRGADPNAKTDDGLMSVLSHAQHWPAVGKGCSVADAVRVLLEAGACPDSPST